jgi:hypothetical protein
MPGLLQDFGSPWQTLVDHKQKPSSTQVLDYGSRSFRIAKHLAKLTALTNAFEQGQPFMKWRFAVFGNPLDSAQPFGR